MRNFAKRLMAYEAESNKSNATNTLVGFHVAEKLRQHLAAFMGNTGFYTLRARALALAVVEVPSLRAVRVKANGPLEGLEELQARLDPGELLEGSVVLLAQLLGLLVSFIGEILTVRLVREIWPQVPFNDRVFGNGGQNGYGGQNEKNR